MHEPKTQLRIITALLIVVIALAAGLFFYMPIADSPVNATPTNPPDDPAVHQKVRDAEVSLDPSLMFTQTMGGSGEETVVDVFYNDENIYIFGNTTSTDCDFDSSGAFLAILTPSGKTVNFITYEGTLKAVTLFDAGYVMAINLDEKPVAVAVDYTGEQIKSLALPVVREEEALDIKYANGSYLFVTALVNKELGFSRLKLATLNRNLEFVTSTMTDEVYSLGYVDTLDINGEYHLMANAMSDIRNMLCKGVWGKKLAHYPLEYSYLVSDFWITDSFYYLATTSDHTLLIKDDGSAVGLIDRPIDGGTIVGDGQYMFISVGDYFYCLSGDNILYSYEYGETSFYLNDYIYAVSSKNDRISVRSFLSGQKAYENTFNYKMTSPKIIATPRGLFVIGNTEGKFGGKDITLIKVNY